MAERRRRYLVLQGSDGGQRLFRQQVGARTEELSQFDHQHAEFDGRLAKGHQHFNQHIDVWLHFIITARPGPHHAAALAVDYPYCPEQQPGYTKKADALRKSIYAWFLATHVDVNTFPMLYTSITCTFQPAQRFDVPNQGGSTRKQDL